MKRNSAMNKMVLSVAVFGLAIMGPVFAQDNPPASQSMHEAGQAAEQAGSDTWNAAKHAGEGTVTAIRDTNTTAKVKYALHEEKLTQRSCP
jgi:hypothetical protein